MKLVSVWKETANLLYWTMLAACTVGPGTVVTCARAGSEYDLSLIWALLFASILAFTLQEGTARLTIISGKSLGQCLRVKYKNGAKIYDTALVCWLVAGLVCVGNTLYECNNWAGGIDAVFALPELSNNSWVIRVASCIAYAVAALALLYMDKVDHLGMFLGVVMMGMVALFLVVVLIMGLDLYELGMGLIPNLPAKKFETSAEPTDIILSLVGTTSLGFNLFLGGSMAVGKELEPTQRGIAFSTISALEVSVLILIVGAGTADENTGGFSIQALSNLIESLIGKAGVYVFAIGFIAAALSSMLAVPLGAALTAESVFSQCREELDEKEEEEDAATELENKLLDHKKILEMSKDVEAAGGSEPAGEEESQQREPLKKFEDETGEEEDEVPPMASPEHLTLLPSPYTSLIPGSLPAMRLQQAALQIAAQVAKKEGKELKKLPRPAYWSIITGMVLISTLVIALDAPRVQIILIAQVFNGCLLPFFAICLLLCLNDPQFMSSSPQKGWANIFLVISVSLTLFLTSNVILQKVFGHLLDDPFLKMGIAAGVAVSAMSILCITTSLGKELFSPIWRRRPRPSEPAAPIQQPEV